MKLTTYINIKEKSPFISECYRKYGDKAVFVVPTGIDKEILLEYIEPHSFWGDYPVVKTISDLYDEFSDLTEDKRKAPDKAAQILIFKHVIDAFIAEAEEKGLELPPGVKHPGFRGIVEKNIRELIVEDITPLQYLNKVFPEGEIEVTLPEGILYRTYSDYKKYLEQHSLADIGEVPVLVKECLKNDKVSAHVKEHQYIFTGFLSFTGSQLKMVRAFDSIKEAIFILPETAMDAFYDGISQLGCEYKNRPEFTLSVYEGESADSSLQFYSIAREIALWRRGKGHFAAAGELAGYSDIGVVTDKNSLTALLKYFSKYKIPYSVQSRSSVRDTLMGVLPCDMWSCFVADFPYENTLALLLNPMFGLKREELGRLSSRPDSYEGWQEVLPALPRSVLNNIRKFCFALSKGDTPVALLEKVHDFIKELKAADNISELVREDFPFDYSVKNITYALDELDNKIKAYKRAENGIGEAGNIKLCGPDAIAFLNEVSKNSDLPMPLVSAAAVSVYVDAPPILTSHKYFILTDTDHGKWPGAMKESPLLREEILSRINEHKKDEELVSEEDFFHLPEINERRAQREALFRRLIATAEKCVFLFRSRTDSHDRPIPASQFVESFYTDNKKICRLTEAPEIYGVDYYLPGADEYIFGSIEVGESQPRIKRGVGRVGFKGHNEPGNHYIIRLSDLDTWYQCPFMYWCACCNKIREPYTDVYDRLRAGILFHKIFEESYMDESEIPFVNKVRKFYPDAVKEKYPALTEDSRLKRYEKNFRDEITKLAEVIDTSEASVTGRKSIKTEYELKKYYINDVEIRGVSDRIDIYEDGFVILDYKLGKAEYHKEELQLAAYAYLLQETEGLKPQGYGWIGLRDSKIYGCMNSPYAGFYSLKQSSVDKEKGVDGHIREVKEILYEMTESVKNGEYPANYDFSDSKNNKCIDCRYRSICRINEMK